ncbi:MAG: stage III sporulation protein AE [Thermacetogeniaceae bacterium]
MWLLLPADARAAQQPGSEPATAPVTQTAPGTQAAPDAQAAPNPGDLIATQFEQLNLKDLEGYIRQVDQDLQAQLSDFSLVKALESIRSGQLKLNIFSLLQVLGKVFFQDVLTHCALLGKLLVLGVLLALLEHLTSAFEENTVARLAHGVGILALLTVALSSFTLAVNTGRDAIGNMVGLMQSLLPVILTLMAAMGSLTTVSLMQPAIVMALEVLGTLTSNVVFPLIFCAAILGIVNQLSERLQVSRLAGLFRDGSIILLSLFITVFLGLLSVQGAAGAITDGVGIRTARFATAVFVPVIGKILTDAVDVVVGCSLFMKNAIGIIGAVTLVFLCALPVMKILSAVIVYRLAAALMQPLGAQGLGDALHLLGNYLFIVFAAVLAVGLMFFVTITIVVGLGNVTAMLR